MAGRLFNQLSESDVSSDDIEELFVDLQFMFVNPFDVEINKAILERNCAYIDFQTSTLH